MKIASLGVWLSLCALIVACTVNEDSKIQANVVPDPDDDPSCLYGLDTCSEGPACSEDTDCGLNRCCQVNRKTGARQCMYCDVRCHTDAQCEDNCSNSDYEQPRCANPGTPESHCEDGAGSGSGSGSNSGARGAGARAQDCPPDEEAVECSGFTRCVAPCPPGTIREECEETPGRDPECVEPSCATSCFEVSCGVEFSVPEDPYPNDRCASTYEHLNGDCRCPLLEPIEGEICESSTDRFACPGPPIGERPVICLTESGGYTNDQSKAACIPRFQLNDFNVRSRQAAGDAYCADNRETEYNGTSCEEIICSNAKRCFCGTWKSSASLWNFMQADCYCGDEGGGGGSGSGSGSGSAN